MEKGKNSKIEEDLLLSYKMIKIYTFPNCEKCHEVVDFLKAKGVEYREVNAASLDGRNEFREFSKEYRGFLDSDDKGFILLPIIAAGEDGQKRIYQGKKGLEEFLENETS